MCSLAPKLELASPLLFLGRGYEIEGYLHAETPCVGNS